jgi:hypothetical protein
LRSAADSHASQTCLHTSAYVSIRQHTSAYVSRLRSAADSHASQTCQHTSAYGSIRQRTYTYGAEVDCAQQQTPTHRKRACMH